MKKLYAVMAKWEEKGAGSGIHLCKICSTKEKALRYVKDKEKNTGCPGYYQYYIIETSLDKEIT